MIPEAKAKARRHAKTRITANLDVCLECVLAMNEWARALGVDLDTRDEFLLIEAALEDMGTAADKIRRAME